MAKTILLTAAKEDSEQILSLMENTAHQFLHIPLEVYAKRTDDSHIPHILDKLDSFDNIVHSSIRNARFFLQQVEKHQKKEDVINCLNLSFDQKTFAWLEECGIPTVHPQNGAKPIDLVELMLRLQRMGKTLYPCGSHQREDFPGFLEELDIEVVELDVFDLEGPDEETLKLYQAKVKQQRPDAIIFHSRRAVTRTLAAFPELNYEQATIITADRGITNKLQEKGLDTDAEAEGNWNSIVDLLSI